VKKPYYMVTRAARESAAVIEQFCRANEQILLPILNLIENASQVVETVIHKTEGEVKIPAYERLRQDRGLGQHLLGALVTRHLHAGISGGGKWVRSAIGSVRIAYGRSTSSAGTIARSLAREPS
jgi:hypothetical protein